MQNVSFLKEVFVQAHQKVSLVLLTQKQFKPSINYTLETFLGSEDATIAFVSLTRSAEEILSEIKNKNTEKLFIIDAFSNKSDQSNSLKNIIYVDTPSNIAGIQMGIEKAFHAFSDKNVIIFDSLSVLAIYNERNDFARFLYMFSNKIKLELNTCLFFTVKESTDNETLETAMQFCDRLYDFSELYISSIELEQQ